LLVWGLTIATNQEKKASDWINSDAGLSSVDKLFAQETSSG
jgi:hypothetical protein